MMFGSLSPTYYRATLVELNGLIVAVNDLVWRGALGAMEAC